MLPPGHISAGYLTAKTLLHFVHPNLSQTQLSHLALWGVAFGLAPDLDMIYACYKKGSYRVIGQNGVQHRKFISHAPILWLIAGLAVFFLSASTYFKMFGLIIWLGSWSHFLMDSFDYGVMWLWPFNKKVFSVFNREMNFEIDGRKNIVAYFWNFVTLYSKLVTFYLELAVIIAALIIYFK